MADENDQRSFEDSLTELETRVRRLESGDLPLEDALKVFEEGIALTRECHEKLDGAEERITELTRGSSGSLEEKEL